VEKQQAPKHVQRPIKQANTERKPLLGARLGSAPSQDAGHGGEGEDDCLGWAKEPVRWLPGECVKRKILGADRAEYAGRASDKHDNKGSTQTSRGKPDMKAFLNLALAEA
jgi:hypothetical protein